MNNCIHLIRRWCFIFELLLANENDGGGMKMGSFCIISYMSTIYLCWASSQCSLVLLLISCIRPDLNDSISFILCDDLFLKKNVSLLLGHECRDFVGCPNLAAKIDIDWVIIFTWAASMPCSSFSFCKSLTYYILLFIEFWCFVWVKYVWLTWCITMYYFYVPVG